MQKQASIYKRHISRLFKELTLIVEGFLNGAKTLTWAMVFLFILVYIFAIFARLQIGSGYVCANEETGEETAVEEGGSCPEEGMEGPTFMYLFNEEIGDQS